jgi:hypothetical protein
METNKQTQEVTPQTLRTVGWSSVLCGILGAGFFWWVPMGMVLSILGLVLGFIDSTIARRRSLPFRLSIAGMVISLAALALCIVIAALNLQLLTFGGL